MVRSFFAIDLPAALTAEIQVIQAHLRNVGADVGWTRAEGVHLTLKFLGDAAEDLIEPLAQAAGRVAAGHAPLTLRVAGAGIFPDRRRPRVLWLGLDGDLDRLADLQKGIEAAAAEFGFAPENRPFRPHLTLGRFRSNRRKNELLLQVEKLRPRPLEFLAEEVVLFKSDLKPTGAVYTPLDRLPLKGEKLEDKP